MATLLSHAGHRVHYRVVEGEHDGLCWRGGLTDGLQSVWAASFAASGLVQSEPALLTAQGVQDEKPESVR